MIFVMLGTQKEPFTRLLDYIENSKIQQEVIAQVGYTKYNSKKINTVSFFSTEEIEKYIKRADIIITHGGTGSILTALKHNKKVIACARLKKYGEHVDDHQKELVGTFCKEGYILEIDEKKSLDNILVKLSNFHPKEYVSNTNSFIDQLKKEIK